MLYIVGLGLGEKDISLKGLEIARESEVIYLEEYTSVGWERKDAEKIIGKKITGVDRNFVESDKIVNEAETKDVCLLVYGDSLSATTHIALIEECMKKGIKYKVIHGSSVLTAVGEIGLSLYKFGAVGSIPFGRKNVKSAYETLVGNDKIGLHTLFLLDLDPKHGKFLSIGEGLDYLIENGMKKERLCVVCSRLGWEEQKIVSGKAVDLIKLKMNNPCCLIVVGNMNFLEEEMVKRWEE